MTMAMSGLTLAIYWIGAYLINKAEIMERAEVIGNMTAFTQYALQVVGAFMMLVMIFILLPRTMVSAKRIEEVIETDPSITFPEKDTEKKETGTVEFKNVSFSYQDTSEKCISNISFKINIEEVIETDPSITFPEIDTEKKETGTVEFKNVSFSYQDTSEKCISNISFKIKKGETFAIIGATGTGKTSLINLIPRFYDATEGEVLIDGVNIRNYSEAQLNSLVSIAPQKATLFMGDIKSNITYGCNEEISDDDERITRALEISRSDFVNDLSDGIHSNVAQGGTNFSGGQKQRLSIARAVFKNAEIMIFDDTFSALDYKTDMLVRKAIREKLSETTVIIVAQRIGTIKNADKILVLHDGKAVGTGTHEELLKNCPIYKEIALSQLSAEELEGKENN